MHLPHWPEGPERFPSSHSWFMAQPSLGTWSCYKSERREMECPGVPRPAFLENRSSELPATFRSITSNAICIVSQVLAPPYKAHATDTSIVQMGMA